MLMLVLMPNFRYLHLGIVVLKSWDGVVHLPPVHQSGSPVGTVVGRKLGMEIILRDAGDDDYGNYFDEWWWCKDEDSTDMKMAIVKPCWLSSEKTLSPLSLLTTVVICQWQWWHYTVKKTSSATQSGFAVKRHWPGCQSDSPGEMNQVSRPHLVVVRYPLSISEILTLKTINIVRNFNSCRRF